MSPPRKTWAVFLIHGKGLGGRSHWNGIGLMVFAPNQTTAFMSY